MEFKKQNCGRKANVVELHHILQTLRTLKKILNPKVKYIGTSQSLDTFLNEHFFFFWINIASHYSDGKLTRMLKWVYLLLSRLCIVLNNKAYVDTDLFRARWEFVIEKKKVENLGILFRTL